MKTDDLDTAISSLTSWLLDHCSDTPEDGQGFEDVDAEVDSVRELLLDLRDKQTAENKAINSLLIDIEALRNSDENFGPLVGYVPDCASDDGVIVEWPNLAISAANLRKLAD